MKKPPSSEREPEVPESGLGALCPDAQADGVPCPEVGRECAQCERALALGWREEGAPAR